MVEKGGVTIDVHLSGQRVGVDMDEAATVFRGLPGHVALTRAGAGCISVTVSLTRIPPACRIDER